MERLNVSCEPMDIDLSSQSLKDMEISYYNNSNDNNDSLNKSLPNSCASPTNDLLSNISHSPDQRPLIKSYHINIQRRKKDRNSLPKIVAGIIVIIISLLTYQVYNLKCCEQLNLELLKDTLSSKINGQNLAIKLLIETLELKEKAKIIYFYGGTGVGKTYTSSILLQTIGYNSNVYHYTMPTFESTFSTDLMFGLTLCKMSIVIVDDLTLNDIQIKDKINKLMEKVESLNKEITVILIYNCNNNHNLENRCDKSFSSKLLNEFSEIEAFKRFIQFEPLTETHLRECVKQELGNRKLNDNEFEELLKHFNVAFDGCKGVHSKMKYLNVV